MTTMYSVNYRDKFGEESATISNDGKILGLTLRGVKFHGRDFYSFHISTDVDNVQRSNFTLFEGELCGYSMDFQLPVWLVKDSDAQESTLHVHVEFDHQSNTDILKLEIDYQEKVYSSSGKDGYNSFDEQLTELRDNLPGDVYLKTCWNCAFADYHPGGSGIFGNLACFRNIKSEYMQAKKKQEIMRLWDSHIEDIQEIYLCPEFEKRQPGMGGLYVG